MKKKDSRKGVTMDDAALALTARLKKSATKGTY